MYIYLITNKINGKYYVGKTERTPEERWKGHLAAAFNLRHRAYNYHFYCAIRKYGVENFEHQIITAVTNKQELNNLEQLWIIALRSYDNAVGYNGSMGGEGGIPTEETRRKQSESHKGEKNPMFGRKGKLSHAFGNKHRLGQIVSKETRRKMSESHKDKKRTVKCCFDTNVAKWVVNKIGFCNNHKSEAYMAQTTINNN